MTSLCDGTRDFLLAFADDEHLIGQQHSEWIGIAPFLEEDLAFCSIAQDELGHAAMLYEIVAGDGNPHGVDNRDLDALAFDRSPNQWRSATLVEIPSNDWAHALVRHWLYDTAEQFRWSLVADSKLTPLAEVAARAEKEELFHRRHANGLLDLLFESPDANDRLQEALTDLLPFAVALFEPVAGEVQAIEAGVTSAPFDSCLPEWTEMVRTRFRLDDTSLPNPIQPTSRLRRSKAFAPLITRMREVLDLDSQAVW